MAVNSSICARTTIWAWPIIRAVVAAAHEALARYGYGMASVRFICGTQSVHRDLEERLSAYLSMDDTILYSSCFDANGGLVRDSARRTGRRHQRCVESRQHHRRHQAVQGAAAALCQQRPRRAWNGRSRPRRFARMRLIATDGVVLHGRLDCAGSGKSATWRSAIQALVMVDDSHATGFIGCHRARLARIGGRHGSRRHLTGTLGKALGGASGGYVAARREIVGVAAPAFPPLSVLQQHRTAGGGGDAEGARSPGGFARSCASGCTPMHGISVSRMQVNWDSQLLPGEHPIIPIMLGEAPLAVVSGRAHAGRRASTSSPSPFRWFPMEKRGFGPR